MPHVRLLLVIAGLAMVAACGGGGGGSTTAHVPAATSARKPDATLTLTIVPSVVRHGTPPKKAKSRGRKPKFIDPCCDGVLDLAFYPYNNAGAPAPSTTAGPIPVASFGPTVASVAVFSGNGFAVGNEYDGEGQLLSTNNANSVFYQLDPGTTEAISMSLTLYPADIFLSTDQTLQQAGDASTMCVNVGSASGIYSMFFALLPADADYDYLPLAPASSSTPPPGGLNSSVSLSGITNGTDVNGGTTTINPTTATWNGYAVYNFVYAPNAEGAVPFAPPVNAQAQVYDPQYGGTLSFPITVDPSNCDD